MATAVTPIRVRLKDLREARDLTQAELADLADVRQATVSDIENGKTTRIDLPVLERLCRALNVVPGEVLELTSEAPKKRR